jgi:hypothetical protein
MASIRIFATVCAALFAGLTLTLAELRPAAAQTATEARPGPPLNLLPRTGNIKKFGKQARTPTRVAKTRLAKPRAFAKAKPVAKPFQRTAQRRAAPARTFARRAASSLTFAQREERRAVASRHDDAAVMPVEDRVVAQGNSGAATSQPLARHTAGGR